MGFFSNFFSPPKPAAPARIEYNDKNHPGYVREHCEPHKYCNFCPTQNFVDMGYLNGIWSVGYNDAEDCLKDARMYNAVVDDKYLFVLDPDVGPALYTAQEVRRIMASR